MLLGEADELAGGGAHLGHRAGARVVGVAPEGLDRVDHGQVQPLALEPLEDVAQRRLGRELHRTLGQAHAVGPGADLLDRLLARDVGAGRAALGRRRAGLQQEGRLAHARVAGEQDGRARHQAAAADAVELLEPGRQARRGGRLGLQVLELQAAGLGAAGRGHGAGRPGGRLLDQAVPGAAGRALAAPARMGRAAALTDIDCAVARQGQTPILQNKLGMVIRVGPPGAIAPRPVSQNAVRLGGE